MYNIPSPKEPCRRTDKKRHGPSRPTESGVEWVYQKHTHKKKVACRRPPRSKQPAAGEERWWDTCLAKLLFTAGWQQCRWVLYATGPLGVCQPTGSSVLALPTLTEPRDRCTRPHGKCAGKRMKMP